jgi:hypothetical protein
VFDTLDDDEQETFFVIIRQIEVEAVAALFGIFDGTTALEGQFERFKLTYAGSRHDEYPSTGEVVLSGDLQDFLFARRRGRGGISSSA